MDQKKIGAFIARRRKELDMTQKELAEKLGITDRAVSKWEKYGCLLFQISDDKRCNVTYYCHMRDYWYSGMPDGICRENMVM